MKTSNTGPELEASLPEARIMIVEDESIVALSLEFMLQQMGYQVPAVVASGEDALERARETKLNLVLMDISLAGPMDGIETATLLRDEHALPVVFLTAYSDTSTLERAKRAEPYSYLVKPIQPKDLYATVEIALYKHANDLVRRAEGLPLEPGLNLDEALEQAETLLVRRVLAQTGHNVTAAARLLGTNRARIYRTLNREK
jgi:DNA-binding NtrC family response regulator